MSARIRLGGLIALVVGALGLAPSADAAGPPTIAAAWVTSVTSTSATLHAEVDPEGLATGYRFEYLTEARYLGNGETFSGATRLPASGEEELGSGETLQPAARHLTGLTPGTAYRYRVVATNASSTEIAHTFTTQPAASLAAEECPNAQLRFEDNSFALPDCRAYELVSPVDKNGGAVQGFGGNSGGGVLQAAADGDSITYSSASSFGEGALGAPTASQYIARRGAAQAGWSSQNITAPAISGSYGNAEEGVPYQLFSPDLAAGLLLNGRHCRSTGTACGVANPPLPGSGAPAGYQDYYLRDDGTGSFQSILAQSDLAHTALGPSELSLNLAGATPGLTHVVVSSCAALTANASEVAGAGGCDASAQNLYGWSGGGLTLLNFLPAQITGTPGAHLAAQSGAISTDGARVYWMSGVGDLYLDEAGRGKAVDESGEAVFQTASTDGSLAYFTKAGHLYRYSAQTEAAIDLTPGGGVEGVLGASEDGSHVYYATAAGLFLWDEGTTTPIALSPGAAQPSDYPPTTGTARVSADGSHLVFLSKASLTGFDNTDQHTGQPDPEVYLYNAGGGGGALACVSCNPTGERPLGPSTIPGAAANGLQAGATQAYKPRVLSTTATRLFFDSADQIVPEDASAAADVYQWEAGGEGSCRVAAGCVSLISSGRSAEPSSFVDASADGSDAFFLTGQSILPRDPGSYDIYDARQGGGLPEPEKPIECDGDACQSVPSPPEDPAPGTLVAGQANPPVAFPKNHKKKPKKHHKHKKKHDKKGKKSSRKRSRGRGRGKS